MVDRALVAAENLLQTGDEDQRGNTNAKLRDLKAQWEETCTYIVHCHRCAYITLVEMGIYHCADMQTMCES